MPVYLLSLTQLLYIMYCALSGEIYTALWFSMDITYIPFVNMYVCTAIEDSTFNWNLEAYYSWWGGRLTLGLREIRQRQLSHHKHWFEICFIANIEVFNFCSVYIFTSWLSRIIDLQCVSFRHGLLPIQFSHKREWFMILIIHNLSSNTYGWD